MSHGRALLVAPRFFGYEQEIRDQMERSGWAVDMLPDRPFDTALLKAVARTAPRLTEPAADRFYAAELRRLAATRYDLLLVIQGECVFEPTLRLLRTAYPTARMVFYTWDSLSNKPQTRRRLRFYDQCFSFDESDAASCRIDFRPLFFTPGFERAAPAEPTWDISFVGTIHSDRYRIVKALQAELPDPARGCWYLYLQAPWMYAARKVLTNTIAGATRSEFRFEPLPKARVQEIFFRSRAVLDIEHPAQHGLTMRTLEALGSRTKLVTTNATASACDFFDRQNIAIVDRRRPRIPPGFLTTPFRPLAEEIYDRYRLATWVREVCGPLPERGSPG
ncbi:MAG: hypothetical protein JF585_04725 [Burkholderiales bacterium]|nr:hypothetical protein [Burkholderiales bacterium]